MKHLVVVLVLLAACESKSKENAREKAPPGSNCLVEHRIDEDADTGVDLTFCFLPDGALMICDAERCITNSAER